MLNGKIIVGSISIIFAMVAFFDILGDLRSGISNLSIIYALVIVSLAIIGITIVRSGISNKRKTS